MENLQTDKRTNGRTNGQDQKRLENQNRGVEKQID